MVNLFTNYLIKQDCTKTGPFTLILEVKGIYWSQSQSG